MLGTSRSLLHSVKFTLNPPHSPLHTHPSTLTPPHSPLHTHPTTLTPVEDQGMPQEGEPRKPEAPFQPDDAEWDENEDGMSEEEDSFWVGVDGSTWREYTQSSTAFLSTWSYNTHARTHTHTHSHTSALACARTSTFTRTRTHTCTHTHTDSYTHARTHSTNNASGFSRQQGTEW